MDSPRFGFRLAAPLPMLTGISQLGDDRLPVRVGHPAGISFVRSLPPNYAGVKEALELGPGGLRLVDRVYGHLGQVRHRSDVVEYRLEQHEERLRDRLSILNGATRGR